MSDRYLFVCEINVLYDASPGDNLLCGPFAGSTHLCMLMNLGLQAGRKHHGDRTEYNGLH